jgi:hypothetical protein
MSTNTKAVPADQLVWGAQAIAPHLGRTVKGTFGALESGRVPGAKKVAGRWGLNLAVFYASFGAYTCFNALKTA